MLLQNGQLWLILMIFHYSKIYHYYILTKFNVCQCQELGKCVTFIKLRLQQYIIVQKQQLAIGPPASIPAAHLIPRPIQSAGDDLYSVY